MVDAGSATSGPVPPTPRSANPAKAVAYAGMGRRFAAWSIDFVIVWGPVLVALGFAPDHDNVTSMVAGIVIVIPAMAVLPTYYVLMHGSRRGQTVGKMALGIAVRDAITLGPIGYRRAFVRSYLTAAFWLFAYLPALADAAWILVSNKSQMLHDLAARSVVIEIGGEPATPEGDWQRALRSAST
jgi:uncharacterized RDD family membrane protein YckC